MAVIRLDCPNCGAKLQPDDSQRRANCQYCGATFELARPKTTYTVPPQVATHAAPEPVTPQVRAQIGWLLFGVGIALAIAMGTVVFSLVSMPTSVPVASGAGVTGSVLGAVDGALDTMLKAANTNAASDVTWDQNGGRPKIVTLDGAEYVVGRVTSRGERELFIGVFAADTGAERYRVGPFGTYNDGYRATHFAVADGRLLVTDLRGSLRVFDLASGAPVQDIALTDRAKRFCLLDDASESPRLYLELVDKREFRVDAAAPALKEEKLPKACDARERLHARADDPVLTSAERRRQAPKVDGIEVQAVHLAGSLGVARGHKSPGTAYPMAFGFDPKSREVRWKTPVAAVDLASVRERDNEQDILVEGRYFATYGEGSEYWHLTAFDAMTGARLWDNKLRSIFAVDWLWGIEATANHVFLVRMSSVEVYDAATGALKATIGRETYDG
jgi:hypothetical protein